MLNNSIAQAAILLCCLAVTIPSNSHDGQKEKSPLSISLTATNRTICAGSDISVEAEITNISDDVIVIDPRFLWSRVEFSYTKPSQTGLNAKGVQLAIGHSGSDDKFNYQQLRPGVTYKDSNRFSTKGAFFKKSKEYEVRVIYTQFPERHKGSSQSGVFSGTVSSNSLNFRLKNRDDSDSPCESAMSISPTDIKRVETDREGIR